MTETEVPTAAAEPDPAHPYTETALARILLCDAYREVAETALARIPTDSDGSDFTGPGDTVRAAASLLALAEGVMRRAAIYERERGTSWEELGEALGITKQSAHKRFAGAVDTWRAPFDRPARVLPDGTPDDERIPYGVRYAPGVPKPEHGTAEDHAQGLERWLLQHTGPTDHWHSDEHPVTGGLPRHSTTSMLMLLGSVSARLLEDQLVPDPRAEADVAERRAALYERMLREDTVVPAEIHQWIEKDRARAAALRATPGTGTPWPAAKDNSKETP
ncbi:hypothetical protein P1P68_02445 [Streptomyces scabiei]|uniref:hypothetical protein n=1 Tax=Streptomyces scabiei TaxID=1930 RepID=UPI0029901612|nr:hypothetical protein [Streptomyces scabiei]MDW8803695.1 hypothetical protein [Streptomyces scabiei]